ncbi:MAG: NADH-quinone oxidoreductase subunit NuoH [Rickettsiales bacterium]|nr:NADH-quinone oxidoreductase subunit NuoH [Rickettsiales bacterium]|tara:strand:+ start:6019 stop:7032 length:1014 start_codon:yes stop_codon:yes gene_type:complete
MALGDLINMLPDFVVLTMQIVLALVGLLLAVAYLTYFERKIIAAMQLRQGPTAVGVFGLMQPLADGLKLFFKESILPRQAHSFVFYLAPIVTFMLGLMAWAVIPVGAGLVFANINVGVLYLLAISSMGVYGIIMAGWASNSRYAFLGGLRSAAQMISYEVSMGLIVMTVLLCAQSMNLSKIVMAQQRIWYVVPLFPMFVLFLVSILAETNRTPFDLPEAEAELVSGYNVEYSSMPFALFFLGEYANMILMSSFTVVLFLGGWLPPFEWAMWSWIPGPVWFGVKVAAMLFFFIWVRATLPRFRYDQLMRLGWKVFLPISLGWLVLTALVLLTFNWFER